jgi:pimeloyl-ACP methyl ester carboxylesterase
LLGRTVEPMPYIDINDIHMYYDDLGSGPPLVLLNGATGTNADSWQQLRPKLAEHFRVLHIEHRGHGRTNNTAGYIDYELVASDIIAFIEKLELAPVNIAGISDGGIHALVIGMRRPDLVQALVPIGANYCNDEQVLEANRVIDVERIERELHGFREQLERNHDPHHHPGYWRTLVSHLAENLSKNPDYSEDDLRAITAPTLLISGEADLWCNVSQILAMRRAIPNSEMLILNHAGLTWMDNHDVNDTRADLVGPAMLEFLQRHQHAASSV